MATTHPIKTAEPLVTPPHVLVVEDDPALRESLLDLLRNKGYAVKEATGQQEAQINLGWADVVLIDLRLSQGDGVGVLRQFKEQQLEGEAIIMTGYAELGVSIQCLNLGAFGFMEKPVKPEQLFQFIHRALERRNLRQQLERRLREIRATAELHMKALNERVQFLEESTRLGERLNRIYGILSLVAQARDPMDMAQDILRLVQGEVSTEYASLTLVNPDGTLGKRADSFRRVAPFSVAFHPGGLAEQILKTGQSQYIADVETDPRANPDLVRAGICCYMGMPLKGEDKIVGILFVHSTRPNAFAGEREFLESIASAIGMRLLQTILLGRVERAKQEWETVFDAIGDGVAVIDGERLIVRANRAFAQLVAKAVTELAGKKICTLVHGREEPIPDCPLERAIATGGLQATSLREPYLGNKVLDIKVFLVPVKEGEVPRYVYLVRVVR